MGTVLVFHLVIVGILYKVAREFSPITKRYWKFACFTNELTQTSNNHLKLCLK
jgi:hypothetical protein